MNDPAMVNPAMDSAAPSPSDSGSVAEPLAAFSLADGKAVGQAWRQAWADRSPMWLHLDRKSAEVARWLRQESGLDPLVCNALLTESTRPRVASLGDGFLINVRGVNLNPGAEPEDMISIRMWTDSKRLISLQGPRLKAVEALIAAYAEGRGPAGATGVGDFVVALVEGLTDRMAPVLDELGEKLDELEDRVIDPTQTVSRHELVTIRQRAITIRRYLAPQVQCLTQLVSEPIESMGKQQHKRLREQINRTTRYVEDLEAARIRGAVIQDELASQLAERANNRIYMVTVIAAIFLPLGLIAGMLGMNVGGVPLASHPLGFIVTTVSLAFLGFAGFWLVRRFDWL